MPKKIVSLRGGYSTFHRKKIRGISSDREDSRQWHRKLLNRKPDMVEWGLMEDVDPADYFGKPIEVERFKAIASLAIQGEILN